MINLHYSKKEGQILKRLFDKFVNLGKYINIFSIEKAVHLIAIEGKNINEVFVTDSLINATNFIFNNVQYKINDVFFFEFASFEEAYKVALSMKEPNPLCYEEEQFI